MLPSCCYIWPAIRCTSVPALLKSQSTVSPHLALTPVLLPQADDQVIVAGTLRELLTRDFGPPLHSLLLAGDVHVTEEEMLAHYRIPAQAAEPVVTA